MGSLDSIFDRDNDGELDFFESYEEQDFFDRMEKRGIYEENDEDEEEKDSLDFELSLAGLDRDELEMMDDDERAEALEDAGIDPDDWEDM
ncbi:MAG: uroporphyrin-III methyltransferase [Lachnospiraceae bacterium]|nr:uroporphyrin-III methyltransferase [Lachnospiraceae bacterium]